VPKRTPVGPFEPKARPLEETKKRRKRPNRPPPSGTTLNAVPSPVTPQEARAASDALHGPTPEAATFPMVIPPAKPLEDITPEEFKSNAAARRYLRWAAGLYYSTDMHGCTLEQLNRLPEFKSVPYNTLMGWSATDRWVDRRQKTLEQWRQAVELKIGSELVQNLRIGLGDIKQVQEKLLGKIQDDNTLQPRSLEGAIAAYVKIKSLEAEFTDKVARAVIPDIPSLESSAGTSRVVPNLSHEETREVAKFLIDRRRRHIREDIARNKATDDLEPGDDGR